MPPQTSSPDTYSQGPPISPLIRGSHRFYFHFPFFLFPFFSLLPPPPSACHRRHLAGRRRAARRLTTGFGDCALRRVESHRKPKPKAAAALGHHLGGGAAADGDEDDHAQHHRIKCAGFFGGGIGAAPPPSSSSYWLSTPDVCASGGSARSAKARSHRTWAWALASPMRALRPASSSSSKSIMAAPHGRAVGNNGNGGMPLMAAVATS